VNDERIVTLALEWPAGDDQDFPQGVYPAGRWQAPVEAGLFVLVLDDDVPVAADPIYRFLDRDGAVVYERGGS
jgi:hypothetical protein